MNEDLKDKIKKINNKIHEINDNSKVYDIRVCRGPKRSFSVEEKDGLTIFRVFFSDSFEFKKANAFVLDCIIDGLEAKQIFDLVKKKNFVINTIEAVKKAKLKAKEQSEYKVRKFLGSYYFNYTK